MKECVLHKSNSKGCSQELILREQLSKDEVRTLHITSGCKKYLGFACTKHHLKYLLKYANHQRTCCDPLNLHAVQRDSKKKRTPAVRRSLSEITLKLRRSAKLLGLLLIPGQKLCVNCKKELLSRLKDKLEERKAKRESASVCESTPSLASAPCSQPVTGEQMETIIEESKPFEETIDGLNVWLSSLGLSPIDPKKFSQKTYCELVMKRLKAALRQVTNCGNFLEDENAGYFDEMIKQLQTFIRENNDQKKKLLALTVVPKSWSSSKIEQTFGVSNHLVRKSRQLVASNGILSQPSAKKCHSLSKATEEKVVNFYMQDDVSRPLPGKKDFVSVKVNEIREHKRKRLVLSTLSDLHEKFTMMYPDQKIPLGKFCELRPKECVLAGRAGTHVICVCTYHQNPVLMFEGADLKSAGFDAVRDCRSLLLCSKPKTKCYFRKCNECPSHIHLQERLELYFDSEMIDEVTYNQCESTDRGNIVTITKSTDDFTDDFIMQMDSLITHDFIAKQQSEFYKKKIEELEEGEVVVNLDFAENFTFVQNSSQSFYFTNNQATIHPFVIYFKENGETFQTSYVIISNHMDHSTEAVYTFQKRLIAYLRKIMKNPLKKIYYFSDGCTAQYKNKKAIANVWYHERDFGVPAEWHFYATSHGKSACDGGMLKHAAMLHSLRSTKPGEQITTPLALFDWANKNIKGIRVEYVSTEEVAQLSEELTVRFQTAFDIDGIRSHHSIIPRKLEAVVEMKAFWFDKSFVTRKISLQDCELNFSDVRGFVMYTLDQATCHLDYIVDSDNQNESFKIQVLLPIDKQQCYKFKDEISTIYLSNILTLVSLSFQDQGRVVKVLAKHLKAAAVKVKTKVSS